MCDVSLFNMSVVVLIFVGLFVLSVNFMTSYSPFGDVTTGFVGRVFIFEVDGHVVCTMTGFILVVMSSAKVN